MADEEVVVESVEVQGHDPIGSKSSFAKSPLGSKSNLLASKGNLFGSKGNFLGSRNNLASRSNLSKYASNNKLKRESIAPQQANAVVYENTYKLKPDTKFYLLM
jgi:hypothetical protein